MLLTPLVGTSVSVVNLQTVFATAAVIFALALLLSLALARRPAQPAASALASEPAVS